jgi:tRNA-specific 2-thiouridylase
MKRVFVGLSGGVDSSVAALLLKQAGYEVIGVYMKNWSQDLPGVKCPWKEDYQDAKRIAVQLGIEFKMYDFESEYRHRVVDYMVKEYKAGRTPNPDIMCNQEVKFKLFLETAIEDGADYIATGHYAKIVKNELGIKNKGEAKDHNSYSLRHNSLSLAMAKDANKDQTYFLYRISPNALDKVLFPLGDLTKKQVRELAKKHALISATRKESMGICFVGNIGIKEFLSQYVDEKPGKVINQHAQAVGEHEGAIFYTIGQRHGLNVGGGLPYYVTGKDMKKNEVYVTTDLQDDKLWSRELKLADAHWLDKPLGDISVRTRHRSELIPVKKLDVSSNLTAAVELEEEVRALTPGQSAVFYSGERVLGGGIVV